MDKIKKDIWNDEIVINLNKKLKEIDENLSIGVISFSEDKIHSVGITIQVKGNANLIKKLEILGFEKTFREKGVNNKFYQKMTYNIHYDKYAIYKTEYGLRASLYIDNYPDFKRNRIFGNPDFPMIVNRVGGHTSFILEYEEQRGFIGFKEVLEGKEPLTREEMFPKNSEKFLYGWIDLQGNTYTCSFENHHISAESICKELGFSSYNSEKELEKRGWIKVSRKAPYTNENRNSRTVYSAKLKFTKDQIKTIYKEKLDADKYVRWMLEEN